MAREIGTLSAVAVRNQSKPGLYGDGGGLYLQVTPVGAKTWIFRFQMNHKRRDMGLGPVHTVGLAAARDEARKCRLLVRDGIDPIEQRKSIKLTARASEAKAMTFKQCAQAYIKAHEAGWKNDKHIAQWTSTLESYAYPTIGALPVAGIDTGLVMKCVEPIWTTKTETASRVRGRIESILDWAAVHKYRLGENPARWKGHLDHLLPARAKVQKAGHHAALPYDQIGEFMKDLSQQDGNGGRTLEFAVLTATRTNEVLGAVWDEVDLDKKLWTIPADRMKAGKEHRIPLSDSAIAILEKQKACKVGDYIFFGQIDKNPLSNMAMLMVLRRMKRNDLTAHGFRSTFRDWAAERTVYPAEVAEMAFAHTVSDKVEAAYRRGVPLEKRVRIMQDWADFCGVPVNKNGESALNYGQESN